MAGVNKVILIGNLGADPEVRYTQGGAAVANLRLATSETWNDKDGNRQERTEWHSVTVWGKLAENCGKYLAKGRQVYVEGRLQSRVYEDKDGIERKVWDVVASQVTFLASGRDDSERSERPSGGGGSRGRQGGSWGGGGSQGGGSGWGGGSSQGQDPQGGGSGWGGAPADDDPVPF